MKQITFASFKGGAGKTTALMAVTSALVDMNKKMALIDTDDNFPLSDWQSKAKECETWSDKISIHEADDVRSFEKAYEAAIGSNVDYMLIDTRGGGSELNDACVVNTDCVVIPSALTQLDMEQALTTFQHVIEIHQAMNEEIPTALLFQRVPVGKLTVSQKHDLEALSDLPCLKTKLHSRDAFASLGKRGLLHAAYNLMKPDPMKRITASHLATAMDEARDLTNDLLALIGEQ